MHVLGHYQIAHHAGGEYVDFLIVGYSFFADLRRHIILRPESILHCRLICLVKGGEAEVYELDRHF